MVKLHRVRRPGSSPSLIVQIFSSNSFFRNLSCFVIVLLFTMILRRENGIIIENETTTATITHKKVITTTGGDTYCQDPDDPPFNQPCSCPAPYLPVAANRAMWQTHHERLVRYAQQEAKVVFIGDSITERWNGTRNMGSMGPYPEVREIFTRHFPNAIALGSSGDTTNHLLWHLKNNLLSPSSLLQPAVIVLGIGTNNLGRWACSKDTTVAGVGQVLKLLQTQRFRAKFVLTALLPRDDRNEFVKSTDTKKYQLGRLWETIRHINTELEKQCRRMPHCTFVDSGHLFLNRQTDDYTLRSRTNYINSTLMDDGLHPTAEGYELWARQLQPIVDGLVERNKLHSGLSSSAGQTSSFGRASSSSFGQATTTSSYGGTGARTPTAGNSTVVHVQTSMENITSENNQNNNDDDPNDQDDDGGW